MKKRKKYDKKRIENFILLTFSFEINMNLIIVILKFQLG